MFGSIRTMIQVRSKKQTINSPHERGTPMTHPRDMYPEIKKLATLMDGCPEIAINTEKINKKAKLYLQGETVDAVCYGYNNQYISPMLFFKIISGKYAGEKIATLEYGDKFMEWL